MPDTLPVHLNRESLHSLSVPAAIETDGSFDVVLVNHGEAVHVHLHLDDALSRRASIDANNHYVKAESRRPIRVSVDRPGAGRGKLKVVTSYGAETRYVDVDLVEPAEDEKAVQVDESLGSPQTAPPESSTDGRLGGRVAVPVLGLAGLAAGIATVAALTVDNAAVLVAAGAVVLAAVLGTAFVLLE